MTALRDHFVGEVNATRRIAEAERLRNSLCYNKELSLSFEKFLTKYQNMFNIYEKQGEPIPEDANIRFIFDKVRHDGLQLQIKALKASIVTGTSILYTTADKHISRAVSQLSEYSARNRVISGVDARGTSDGMHNPDGSIISNKWI